MPIFSQNGQILIFWPKFEEITTQTNNKSKTHASSDVISRVLSVGVFFMSYGRMLLKFLLLKMLTFQLTWYF